MFSPQLRQVVPNVAFSGWRRVRTHRRGDGTHRWNRNLFWPIWPPGTLAARLAGLALLLASVASGQSMPELTLSVGGRLRSSAVAQQEHAAFVELEFSPPARPAPSTVGVRVVDYDAELEDAPGTELPLDPLERDDTALAESNSRTRRSRSPTEKRQALLSEVPYVLTPVYVREAVEAALAAQGLSATLSRLESLTLRAKTSALLPEVRLRAGRDVDQSMRLSPTADDPYRYSQSGTVAFVMDGSVTWRLSRLAFASEEISIERLRLAQSRERQRVTASTMAELLTWQLAWRRAAAIGEKATAAVDDLAESSLRLDVLTGGWFSAHQPAGDPLALTKQPAAATGAVPRPGRAPFEGDSDRRRAGRQASLPRDLDNQNASNGTGKFTSEATALESVALSR